MAKSALLSLLVICIYSCDIGLAQQSCPSKAENCIETEKFNQLSPQSDDYCLQGPILAAAAQNCLKACGFSEADPTLADLKNKIDNFCKTKDDKCDKVTDVYVAQTRCFDQYYGLENITNKIVPKYIKNEKVDCQEFYWGRYCQRTQRCSFNAKLDQTIVREHPSIALMLAICGSETIKDLVPALDRTDGCKPDTEKQIVSKCNISCPAANAQNSETLCRQLEKQASCLEELTQGCTSLEKRAVLPRLNTYAAANKYLYCNIQYRGVPVRHAGRECQYSSLINSCLLTGTVENALTFYQLQPLMNRDTVVLELCRTKSRQNDMLIACRNAFYGCITVQAKLFLKQNDADDETAFLPEIGGFPLDHHGMKYLYDVLPAVCPKGLMWSDQICVPDYKNLKRSENEGLVKRSGEDFVHRDSRDTPEAKYTPTRQVYETPSQDARDFHRSAASSDLKKLNLLDRLMKRGETVTCGSSVR